MENQFWDAAQKHCRDNKVEPQLCISTNMKGEVYMVGNPNLTNAQRLYLINTALKTMMGIMQDEAIGYKNAKVIDLSKGKLHRL